MTAPARLCAVNYLNTVPLIWGFLERPDLYPVSLSIASPAECAQRMRAGTADVGLVPVAEIHRQGLEVIGDSCISCDGEVRSILMVSRKPWAEVKTLAGDENSRTSVVLAQVILKERFGVSVEMTPHRPIIDEMLENADAAVLIGDPALQLDVDSLLYPWLDLGAEWLALTGLPMVFATWAARELENPEQIAEALEASLARGEANLDAIVNNEAGKHGVSPELAREYLTQHIRFHLGERERSGMQEFLRLASAYGLVTREVAEGVVTEAGRR